MTQYHESAEKANLWYRNNKLLARLLTASEYHMFGMLAGMAHVGKSGDPRNGLSSVSRVELQRLLRVGNPVYDRSMASLKAKGLVNVYRQGTPQSHMATVYFLPSLLNGELPVALTGSTSASEEPIPHNIEAPTREAPVKKTAVMPVLHEPKRVVDPVEQLISESWHGLTVLMDQFYAAVPRSEVASDAALRIKLREYIIATRKRFMLRDISSDELTREVLVEALAESITVHAFACNKDDRIKAPTSLLLSHVLPVGISPQSAMLR